MLHRLVLPLIACLVLIGECRPAHAQSDDVRLLSQQRHSAETQHLWRVGVWGAANALGGLALVGATARSERTARWNFGAMSAGWGVVNVGIAAAGLLAGDAAVDTTLQAALGAERTFHDILLVNLGLNVGYAAVGGAMLAAGARNVDHAARWRGFGTSLILQGAGLLVLDGIAFLASRTRLGTLLDTAVQVSAHVHPTGAALTLQL